MFMLIEKVVLDYLDEELDVPAYMEKPADPPESYVIVIKTGSGVTDFIYRATMVIQSVAPTLYEAALLNEAVKRAMDSIITLDEITHSSLNSDYEFTNTATKERRYQAVYDLVHYGGY